MISYFIAALCFVMGLQNALITKVSSAIIRTTHITGMTTDLGIEIGRLLSGTKNYDPLSTKNNVRRHSSIILAFFTGGVLGAMGVNSMGTTTFVLIALVLVALGYPQLRRDFAYFTKPRKEKRESHHEKRPCAMHRKFLPLDHGRSADQSSGRRSL